MLFIKRFTYWSGSMFFLFDKSVICNYHKNLITNWDKVTNYDIVDYTWPTK